MTLVDGRLNEIQLREVDSAFSSTASRAIKYRRYYRGENPNLLDAPAKDAPDNRVPVPFAGKIVRTIKGYMAKPGAITYFTSNPDFQSELKRVFDENDEELLTGETLAGALTYGKQYEIVQLDENLNIRIYQVPATNGLAIYDDTLEHRLIAFIYRVRIQNSDGSITENQTIYYADVKQEYTRNNMGALEFVEERQHGFDRVPVAVYQANAESLPAFYQVLAMIDEHDKIISSSYADERERFANSYLLMLKKISTVLDDDGLSDVDKLAQLRIFDDLGRNGQVTNVSQAVGFLTKPSRGSEASESADRFERLIYDQAMVINPNEDGFAASSGIALRYKLLPMEWMCADIEGYFSRGLQQRIYLVSYAMNLVSGIPMEMVTIRFRRNLPSDLESIVNIAGSAQGILSDRTILGLFPADVVPDPEAELAERDGILPEA